MRNRSIGQSDQITQQLVDLYSQLAFHKGSELRLRQDTINLLITNGSNITTAREQASFAVQSHTHELIRIQGEIDGLLLALAHIDRVLAYWTELDT